MNTYAYVGGNPLIYFDSNGLRALCGCQATGPTGYNASGQKECKYQCKCACNNNGDDWDVKDSTEVRAHSNAVSRESYHDWGSKICIGQRSVPDPEFPGLSNARFDLFPVDTGSPGGPCYLSPELCEKLDKECEKEQCEE